MDKKPESRPRYNLKYFYKAWEKYACQFISPKTPIKTSFDLFLEPQFKKFMAASPVLTYVINHATSRYEFISDNSTRITGYSPDDFLKGGVAFGMSITDEEYTDHVGNYLIPKIFEYTEKYAALNELDKIQFSYNYRLIRKDKVKIWNLQLMTILEADELGNALLTLVHMIDISHIKKDDKVDFCVSKRNPNGLLDVIYIGSYPEQNQMTTMLSARELQILTLISQGKSSKTIADHLSLSINTIHNHRKRMLVKTGCKNSSELINYGRCKGIAMPFI